MSVDGTESNGSGKSSLFEAPEWALWGSLSRMDNPKADDVINKIAGQDCLVRVEFEHAGKTWIILRARKHNEYGTCLRWWVNGEEKTKHDSRETSKELSEALPMSHQVYRYAVQVGQGMPDRFLSLSETAKQDLLSEIIELGFYDEALERAKAGLVESESQVRTHEGMYERAEEELDALKIRLQESKDQLESYEVSGKGKQSQDSLVSIREKMAQELAVRDLKQTAAAAAEGDWRKAYVEAEEARSLVDRKRREAARELEEQRSRILSRVDTLTACNDAEYQEQLSHSQDHAAQWASYVNILQTKAASENESRSLRVMVERILDEVNGLKSQPSKCPTCGQEIDTRHLAPRIQELEQEYQGKMESLRVAALTDSSRQEAVQKAAREAADAGLQWKAALNRLRSDHQTKILELRKECEVEIHKVTSVSNKDLSSLDDDYNSRVSLVAMYRDAYTLLVSEVQEVQRSIDTLQEQGNLLLVQVQEYEKKMAVLRERVLYVEEEVKKRTQDVARTKDSLSKAEHVQKHWAYWKQNIPNLRAASMGQILDFLNTRIAKYMDVFSGGVMGMELIQVPYGQKSKIKVDLRTPGGSYEMSSGGERRRVDLSIYLALSDLLQASSGYTCNLTVADEIMDGLSPQGVGKFLDVLRRRAENGNSSVFVVSHNPSVLQTFSFDYVWTVERRGGKARVT